MSEARRLVAQYRAVDRFGWTPLERAMYDALTGLIKASEKHDRDSQGSYDHELLDALDEAKNAISMTDEHFEDIP